MSRLFGTDGVRGVANQELTPELAFKLGVAGAYVLSKKSNKAPNIIIGNDSRISADMLEAALTAGMCSVGANVYIVDTLPTPAIAYLVRKHDMTAGVMISASHNKVADNGIKFFNEKGLKLSDEIEDEIEDLINNKFDTIPRATGLEIGRKFSLSNGVNEYIDFLQTTVTDVDFSGLTVAIDCANGATSFAAKETLEAKGAKVLKINASPDGTNINANCGSTHINVLADYVKANPCDLGFSFDGDGDRVLAVDSKGDIVDGDQILAILGEHLKAKGNLKNNTIVTTIMANMGLKIFGRENDIEIATTAVGDRYVLEYMLENNCNIGGEQSGHFILTDFNTTGDGILTAIQLLSILKTTGKSFSELNTKVTILPQTLVNAKVNNKIKYEFMKYKEIRAAIEELEAMFKDEGRVLIRPSGTEPLVRVMIEGKDKDLITREAKKLAELIEDIMF